MCDVSSKTTNYSDCGYLYLFDGKQNVSDRPFLKCPDIKPPPPPTSFLKTACPTKVKHKIFVLL